MKIIAFGHKKRTGKDTACRHLEFLIGQNTDKTVQKVAFADKLYDIAHQLYAWDGQKSKEYYEKNGDAKEILLPTIGKTPRQILIDLGTPAIRNCVYPNTWVDYTLKTSRGVDVLLISDLRFPNEFKAVKDLGGLCVKVTRASVAKTDDVADNALDGETGWDYVINNDAGLADLRKDLWNNLKDYINDSNT